MSIFAFGINHKNCPVEVREVLHFDGANLRKTLSEIPNYPSLQEVVILSTCNRVEFYGHTESILDAQKEMSEILQKSHGLDMKEYQNYFHCYEGKQAIRHLFRVAAGLDSLVVGENEILGQIRDAFRIANEEKTVHSLLYRLMEKSLKVGKSVREKTKINQGAVSIPSVAVELAEKIFGKLSGEKVMVLGVGEMSTLALENLKNSGAGDLFVASRNQEKGSHAAERFEAVWVPFDQWEKHLPDIDILIASTSAEKPVVTYPQIKRVMEKRKHRPLFLIDIAVPRNIEAEINSLDDVYLYNIDDLKGVSAANLKLRSREIKEAEEMVEKAMLEYQGWLEQLKARPVMEKFEEYLNEVLEKELRHHLKDSVSGDQQQQIRDRIRAKILHPPFEKIKEASQNGGVTRYLEALHSLFDLDKKDKHSL